MTPDQFQRIGFGLSMIIGILVVIMVLLAFHVARHWNDHD